MSDVLPKIVLTKPTQVGDKDIYLDNKHYRVDRRCNTYMAIDWDNENVEVVPVREIL